jgi:hypothetical protein
MRRERISLNRDGRPAWAAVPVSLTLVTATSERGLELTLVHLGSALDAKPLGVVVELFLRPFSGSHQPTSFRLWKYVGPAAVLTTLTRRKRRN